MANERGCVLIKIRDRFYTLFEWLRFSLKDIHIILYMFQYKITCLTIPFRAVLYLKSKHQMKLQSLQN
jgi:hypothetical protein